jgi:hypothetical protein
LSLLTGSFKIFGADRYGGVSSGAVRRGKVMQGTVRIKGDLKWSPFLFE